MTTNTPSTSTISMPRLLLHLEGLALLVAAVVLYRNLEYSWGTFALFLLAPDLAMIPYMVNKRVGQIVYNIFHTIILPLVLAFYSVLNANDIGIQASLIWFAHIGMDHLFGYGFKYPGSFKETHFSRI